MGVQTYGETDGETYGETDGETDGQTNIIVQYSTFSDHWDRSKFFQIHMYMYSECLMSELDIALGRKPSGKIQLHDNDPSNVVFSTVEIYNN